LGFKKRSRKKNHSSFFNCLLNNLYLLAEAFNEKIALFGLAALLIVMIELEFLRIERGIKVPIINWLWKYKRPEEKNRLGGEVFFLIGAIISLALFDIRIAIAAILMTTFGDFAAAIIGKRFGKIWITKNKALEGILAELIVNLIIGIVIIKGVLWQLAPVPQETIWPIIVVMAITATFVETVVTKLDDNLLIPVFSGFNGQLIIIIAALMI